MTDSARLDSTQSPFLGSYSNLLREKNYFCETYVLKIVDIILVLRSYYSIP